jgi:hypothetical protein
MFKMTHTAVSTLGVTVNESDIRNAFKRCCDETVGWWLKWYKTEWEIVSTTITEVGPHDLRYMIVTVTSQSMKPFNKKDYEEEMK